MSRIFTVLLTTACVYLIPAVAGAQGAIAGTARDATGGVLPGVTVEVASPALIEKTRNTVTDATGQYRIVNLRPGVYSVTFSLEGFSTVRREGIELTADFTAPVNADLRLGAMEESITVSGAAPVVDVQNVLQQKVVTRELLEAVPTGRTWYQLMNTFMPGAVTASNALSPFDVGGMAGEAHGGASFHGASSLEQVQLLDGMRINSLDINGATSPYAISTGIYEDVNIATDGLLAESRTGGIQANVIPRSGGNAFKGQFIGNFANDSLQGDNLTERLIARGVSASKDLRKVWDAGPTLGGPLAKDKVWFFGSFRHWGNQQFARGIFYPADPAALVRVEDRSRQAYQDKYNVDGNLRVTWQATPRNKIGVWVDYQDRCNCIWRTTFGALRSPEASLYTIYKNTVSQFTWTAPVTSRLLFEAGFSPVRFNGSGRPESDAVGPSVFEQGSSLIYRAASWAAVTGTTGYTHYDLTHQYNGRVSMSYVTGTHNLKIGATWITGSFRTDPYSLGNDMELRVLRGVPNQVTLLTLSPSEQHLDMDLGTYVQDQWTLRRLTVSGGVRFDYFSASVPASTVGPTLWAPTRNLSFPAVRNVPNWKDVTPRGGVAYDVSGNGKTAIKFSVGKYVAQHAIDIAVPNSPANAVSTRNPRTWADVNGNSLPDGDLFNPAAQPELGPSQNLSFGQPIITTVYDPARLNGWGKRDYNWMLSASIQREIIPSVSLNAAFYHRWFGNFVVTDNLSVAPSDYSPFCVTAPTDPRLPGGGGDQVCGLFDLNPSKVGQVSNFSKLASNYGKQKSHYDGFDLTTNARLPHGATLQGGVSTGNSMTDNCDVVTKLDNPGTRFCHQETGYVSQVKLSGSYPLPWNVQVSAAFQSLAGQPLLANGVFSSAQVRQSLGRDLSTGNATVALIEPGAEFTERHNQVDVRLAKRFAFGRARLQAQMDLYNVLNADTILRQNNTYASADTWQAPTAVMSPRFVKFGVQLDF